MSDTPLAELEVLIVDCQTTGASPALGSVLELGWCVTRASSELERDLEAHWIVPRDGERISTAVRELTGFHEGVLTQALAPSEAWRRLRALAVAQSAIHFARFELSFLRDWSARFEPEAAFPLDSVCVHAIACRLYPDLPRRNLRALAGFLGHGLHLERRALGHVQATAFIWRRLVALLAERNITTWQALSAWLAEPERRSTPRKRRYPIAPASYRTLPDSPGVYRFLRSNGDVLYVGKATSLKKRVSSHFTKQSGATERALEMLTQVSEIAVTHADSALEAALLETRTIKELNPPYNVQLVQAGRGVWFSGGDFLDATQEPDDAHVKGPVSSRYSLRALGTLIQLFSGAKRTPSLRASSVGAPLRWGPDEAAFDAGWALFLERYGAASEDARRHASRVARLLHAREPDEREESTEPDAPKVWDAPRVLRHLERAGGQAYQVSRRAAWLCLLASSSVVYREPGAQQARYLLLDATELVDAGDMSDAAELPIPTPRRRRDIQLAFDAARYDFLRILSTELKRILRDGGEVKIRLSRSRVLSGVALSRVLSVV